MLTLTNARVFDGQKTLAGRQSVTLDGTRIAAVGGPAPAGAKCIDVDGMTLMPGLITSHLHPDFYKFTFTHATSGIQLGKEVPPGVLMAIAVRTCRVLIESGFTGYNGASCSNDIDACLKMAIAEGIIPGPRIRACGHHIGSTASVNDHPNWWMRFKEPGSDLFGDGPDEMRKLVREDIRRGAQTIKIFASSGHGFPGKENAARNMSRDEIEAVVNAAHERGVKVRAHVADKAMILECIELGVDIVDHGDNVDEHCIEKMAKAGTYWVPSQLYIKTLIELGFGDIPTQKAEYANVRRMLPLAHKAGVRILAGDDYSGIFRDMIKDDPLDHNVGCYAHELAHYAAIDGLSAADVLGWATKNPGQLLVDPPAKSGVIETGALADLIVVEGDPVADIGLLSRPQETLKAVIRDGQIVIDRLPAKDRRLAAE